jgi:hypothetical protein
LPGGFPLSDLETFSHLLIKPSKELDITGAVTQICGLESLTFNFVLMLFVSSMIEGASILLLFHSSSLSTTII